MYDAFATHCIVAHCKYMFLTGYLELNKTLIKGIDYKSHYLVYALYQWYTNGQLQRKKENREKEKQTQKIQQV